jgi:hypothetical protein
MGDNSVYPIVKLDLIITGIITEARERKETEDLRGSVYDLRPQGKAQRATLCSY